MNRETTRRDFMKHSALAGLGLAATGCNRTQIAKTTSTDRGRPNFVFVMTDDQAWNTMSCAGHPIVKTPNMDRLAAEGVYFENAFVTTSLCSPSRASFLSGVHAHIHGVVGNGIMELPPEISSYPALLQRSGYETAFIGKWHQNTDKNPNPRPGFDYWLSFRGQGVYENPMLNLNGEDFRQEGFMTDILADYAVQWLQQPRSKPFSLCLWHKAVHQPFTAAPRHKGVYANAVLPEPQNFRDEYADKPEWLRRIRTYPPRRKEYLQNLDKPVPERVPQTEWKGSAPERLAYLESLISVDESLGRVLNTLEGMGQLENTVVVFASDNGYFLGDHRLGDKRLIYEESLRIPLLIRYPKRFKPATKVNGMALNIDIAPTFLELAQVATTARMQGISLVPLMEGSMERVRDSFLYTYFREEWHPGIPLIQCVRTERYKYARYPDVNDIEELYDLENDPGELRNLAVLPEFNGLKQQMQRRLEELLEKADYPKDAQLGSPPVR
ncbi:MAG TPA: sulfatase-like hydrolase/transferase [bacterium]|nr:sulfatase-like hydrolase/transferase [bacterium]